MAAGPPCRCHASRATSVRGSRAPGCLPEVWDYPTNDANGITPDNESFGGHGPVSWLCAKHGRYDQEIGVRLPGHGCKQCADEQSAQKARESENRRARERRAKAREIRQGRGGEVLPFE